MDPAQLPKITVVIATFNAAKTIEACLASIRAQTYRNYEILVADGISTDPTREILRRHAREIALLVSERDRGIYDAWNKVIPHASGEWLIFLGADDELWDAETLHRSAIELAQAREDVVYGRVAITLADRSILNIEGAPWEEVADKFLHEMTIPHQGVFHRRSLFIKNGLFNPNFRICGDYEFLLRELKIRPARFMPNVIVSRMGFGGVSGNYGNVETIIRELTKARNLNGYSRPSVYISLRWIRFYTRKAVGTVFGERAAGFMADVYRRIVGKPPLRTRRKESPSQA